MDRKIQTKSFPPVNKTDGFNSTRNEHFAGIVWLQYGSAIADLSHSTSFVLSRNFFVYLFLLFIVCVCPIGSPCNLLLNILNIFILHGFPGFYGSHCSDDSPLFF